MLHLYFLHGFLGCAEDWEEVISSLPDFKCTALSYPFKIPSNAILIGYSMGGRIALQSPALKRIIFSSHPGLKTEKEKKHRWEKDQRWIEKLKRLTLPQFLDEWYQQPIFETLKNHPHFPHILERRLKQDPALLIDQLTTHSLAHQPYSTPSNTLFIYGEKDIHYVHPCTQIKGAGHAVHLEAPTQCARIIRSWLVQ